MKTDRRTPGSHRKPQVQAESASTSGHAASSSTSYSDSTTIGQLVRPAAAAAASVSAAPAPGHGLDRFQPAPGAHAVSSKSGLSHSERQKLACSSRQSGAEGEAEAEAEVAVAMLELHRSPSTPSPSTSAVCSEGKPTSAESPELEEDIEVDVVSAVPSYNPTDASFATSHRTRDEVRLRQVPTASDAENMAGKREWQRTPNPPLSAIAQASNVSISDEDDTDSEDGDDETQAALQNNPEHASVVQEAIMTIKKKRNKRERLRWRKIRRGFAQLREKLPRGEFEELSQLATLRRATRYIQYLMILERTGQEDNEAAASVCEDVEEVVPTRCTPGKRHHKGGGSAVQDILHAGE